MNSLSLDDQKKLALAKVAYPDVLWLPSNDNGWGYKAGYTWTEFHPKSPDTLMRLCFNLRIDVVWDGDAWEVYNAVLAGRGLVCETPEQIADAILECSMEVINDG